MSDINIWDPMIATDADFIEAYAVTPMNVGETRAQYRARTARELWQRDNEGDKWCAYKVLQNTRMVDYFYWPIELQGAYAGGDIDRTAEIVQARYEYMCRVQSEQAVRRLRDEEAYENFLKVLRLIRKIITLGLWQ